MLADIVRFSFVEPGLWAEHCTLTIAIHCDYRALQQWRASTKPLRGEPLQVCIAADAKYDSHDLCTSFNGLVLCRHQGGYEACCSRRVQPSTCWRRDCLVA